MIKKIVPVVLTFDEGYVIPAGVTMYSLLKTSNPNFIYEFNIIHHGLSVLSQKKLIKNLKDFDNVKIKFIYCDYSFEEEFAHLNSQQHFSPEMFYKLLLPSLLPNYDKVVVSDVDVMFAGDISGIYNNFKSDSYMAVIKHYSKELREHLEYVYDKFGKDYKQRVCNFGAGFYLCNLKEMRKDNIEKKMLSFLKKNISKLVYPEQECLNYVCSKKLEYIDLKYMVIRGWIQKDIENKNVNSKYYAPYTKQQVERAMKYPVQIHYAGGVKPWNSIDCDGFDDWLKSLCDTVFLKDYITLLVENKNRGNKIKLSEYNKKKRKYHFHRLLSHITFGKMHKKHKRSAVSYRILLQNI